MTPDEIKRYLALPEEFRDSRLAHTLGGWQMFDNDGYKIRCPSHHAERLAVASMVVGLRDEGHELRLIDWNANSDGIRRRAVEIMGQEEPSSFVGPSDFLALLAACEAVAKEAKL